jgi:hypothetical protein
MHSVYTEWWLCSKLSKEAIMLLFPLLFFIFVGLLGLVTVSLSLSIRFHFRHNALEQTFDGMHSASKEIREKELALLLTGTLSD